MEHSAVGDCSRESTETIAPFLTIVDVDTTFQFANSLRLRTNLSYYLARCLRCCTIDHGPSHYLAL